jgi:hypothetical protein
MKFGKEHLVTHFENEKLVTYFNKENPIINFDKFLPSTKVYVVPCLEHLTRI